MRRLRIAVDARPLCFPMVGITRYTHELILRLVYSPHEWFIYLDREPLHDLPEAANLHIRKGKNKKAASSTLFAQYIFPKWVKEDSIDVFWSPRHHLPLMLPRDVKTLLTIHDMVWWKYPHTMTKAGYWAERLLMPASIRKASAIITVSEAIKKDVVEFAPEYSDKVEVVHSGFTKIDSDGSRSLNLSQPYFLFVGTLEPRKNLVRLLQAFAIVCESEEETTLVIAGAQGWGKEKHSELMDRLGIRSRVHVVGRAEDKQLANFYKNALALVMPSLYEGFGLPLVEAMSVGVPVITSNRGAMAEVAGDAGILIEPESEIDIARAMLKMLDSETRKKLGLNAISRVRCFNWDKAATKILTLLEEL